MVYMSNTRRVAKNPVPRTQGVLDELVTEIF
jgi:hypothetical protein